MTGIRCTAEAGRNPKAEKGEASNQDDIILHKEGLYAPVGLLGQKKGRGTEQWVEPFLTASTWKAGRTNLGSSKQA